MAIKKYSVHLALDDRVRISAQKSKHFIPKAKERKEGPDASTLPPTNAPKWSIDENWIEGACTCVCN